MNWLALIFPYRTHLEAEIVWLQDQLAQKQRRCDELQEALIGAKAPAPRVQYERKQDGKLVPSQPRGWDAVRMARRENPPEAPEPTEGPFKTEA